MGSERGSEFEIRRAVMGRKIGAVVLAAGKGSRMGAEIPKQYLTVGGKPLIYYALRAFESTADEIVLVTGTDEVSYCKEEIIERYGFRKVSRVVAGGAERYDSVYCGLCALGECEIILIHDGARPCVTEEVIERAIAGAEKYRACVVGMPVKDTIKVADKKGFAACTPDRSSLWMIQTPQGFEGKLIREAYNKMKQEQPLRPGITDDAMVVETFTGCPVKLLEGDYRNIKVTTPEDLPVAECYLSGTVETCRKKS